MNDRYLYRAKRTDDGEWVFGGLSYCEKTNAYFITNMGKDHISYIGFHQEVDSDTICQCTGLKDKNGKLIWENDICRRVLLPTKRIKINFKTTYVPYKCCISAIDLDGSNITFLSDYINNQYEVEVIGNIFDNKELLEREDKNESNY